MRTNRWERELATHKQARRAERASSRHRPSDGAQQQSYLKTAILVAGYLVFAGGTFLLVAMGVVTALTAVLPPGPLGTVILVTGVLGLVGATPTFTRWAFVRGLDIIEQVLVKPDIDSVFQPAYNEEIAIALQVLALHDAGQSETTIGAVTGVSQDTIDTILAQRDELLATATMTSS